MRKALFFFPFLVILSVVFVYAIYFIFLIRGLPSVESLKNYKPPLISTVFDRKENKVGEFFKERRILVPYNEFPAILVQAFVASEDGRFFEHKGLNLKAIFRAFLANIKAGRKVQGGSTITQQVARSLLLSSEKTYKRKLKEAVLALRMEKYLTKEEILFLYLNQIYLGHGSYGVGMAAEIYFRKKVQDLNLAEASLLAGLPQAPSRFSPIYNSKKAKERQVYVLHRMIEENYIDKDQANQVEKTPLKVFLREKYHEKAPYYLETLRQSVLQKIDEELLLTGGLTIKSAMDLSFQKKARKHLQAGLRNLDKRQGFRGPLFHLNQNIQTFFKKEEQKIIEKKKEFHLIQPLKKKNLVKHGKIKKDEHLKIIKEQEIFKALVRKVDDENKKVFLELPFKVFGVLPLENMKWARKPDPKTSFKLFSLKKPSLALKTGDVVFVKVEKKWDLLAPVKNEEENEGKKEEEQKNIKALKAFLQKHFETPNLFNINVAKPQMVFDEDNNITTSENTPFSTTGVILSLEQKPLVEGALIVFDQKTEDILALVGGYDFQRSQFNRAYQATRQTGSVFKPIVYLAALDKGFNPATLITDSPVVYEEEEAEGVKQKKQKQKTEEQKLWKPDNYGRRFSGDILFRNALIRSMNVPTVKIMEKVGIQWVIDYARRLGIFSSLNPDYTLALGSSSVTLYEMTKVFSILGRQGKKISPFLLHEVLDQNQEKILSSISLDERFDKQMQDWEKTMQERRIDFLNQQKTAERKEQSNKNSPSEKKYSPLFFFSEQDQLISQKTAFIMTTLLTSVIKEPQGTGFAAREIKAPVAGKTGTTNGYYDAWFIGYSPQIAVGVWVGFDDEKTLGHGETGARAALPIWLSFMKEIYEEEKKEEFKIPEGIVFTNIDNETGSLVTPGSHQIVRQAFIEGTAPQRKPEFSKEDDQEFLRGDFSK